MSQQCMNNRNSREWRRAAFALSVLLVLALPLAVSAQAADQELDQLEGVGIEEHSGEPIPLDLQFKDSEDRTVTLQDYFDGQRPVVLTLNYYKCPMLCGLMLNGLVDAYSELNWTTGQEFETVTVSINPLEKPILAKQNKQGYLKKLGKPEAARGWHFLTGNQAEITALADAIGFQYKLDPDTKEFLHQAAIFVITPDGRISRYLYGVMYPVKDLKLALSEAADGRIGTTSERIFLACFTYDPASGSYVIQALTIMRIAGILTVIILVLVLGGFWIRDARRRAKRAGQPDNDKPSEEST
ncbi:SCO family protein [bacterium]|nr:SCO family protein [bacterium]